MTEAEQAVDIGDTPESLAADADTVIGPVTASSTEPPVVSETLRPAKIPWWPTCGYASAWAALSVATLWFLTRFSDVPPVQQAAYPLILAAGVTLTLLGPAVGAVVWVSVRSGTPHAERGGLLTTTFVRASAVALGGAATWWLTLIFVDAWRLGRL